MKMKVEIRGVLYFEPGEYPPIKGYLIIDDCEYNIAGCRPLVGGNPFIEKNDDEVSDGHGNAGD
jgi:hypothetical protein